MKSIELAGFIIMGAFLLTACAPAYKAHMDMTASGGIVWPGPPEKPRIRYLWSFSDLSASEAEGKRGFMDVLTGRTREDVSDPQTATTLMRPQGIFADDNRLYIADPGASRVTVVDRKTMDVLQLTEAEGSSLQYPRGVVADKAGTIYVSDSELKKVFVFSTGGKYQFAFKGEFQRPEGMAIDPVRSVVYVVDTDAHCVYRYGTDGALRGKIGSMGGGEGEFFYPTYAVVDREGRLYVTDFLNFRIEVFSADGAFLGSIGILGDAYDTLDKPKGVAVDTEGHVYIVDAAMNTVKIFSSDGRLLLFFGEKGEGYGEFLLPAGIFIDARNVIYVADSVNMRIQAFQFLGGD